MIRHEYEREGTKEALEAKDPTLAQHVRYLAKRDAAGMRFSSTELGRQRRELADEKRSQGEEVTPEDWASLLAAASIEDTEVFMEWRLAGVEQAAVLLEALEVDGTKQAMTDDLRRKILRDTVRANALADLAGKLFSDDGQAEAS